MIDGRKDPDLARSNTQGILYLVSLPIGNLEDITLRALRTLREADFILAEDTRHTRRLLTHFEIDTPFFSSLYQGAERQRIPVILDQLFQGKSLALVSDAGTPLISDPGFPLVRAAIEQAVRVVPVPGPSAGLAALVASGLPVDRFVFVGLLPRKIGERRALFTKWIDTESTIIAYESPHRLISTFEALAETLPRRPVVLARELTKLHEEFLRGTAEDLLRLLQARDEIRGECVLVIGQAPRQAVQITDDHERRLIRELQGEGLTDRTIARVLASVSDLSRNEAYRTIQDLRRAPSDAP